MGSLIAEELPGRMRNHKGAAAQVIPGRMAPPFCVLHSTSRNEAELPPAIGLQQANDLHSTHSLPADVCRLRSC